MKQLLILSTLVFLGACGVKPATVSAPPGTVQDTYPQTYPDIQTDPIPAQMRRITR